MGVGDLCVCVCASCSCLRSDASSIHAVSDFSSQGRDLHRSSASTDGGGSSTTATATTTTTSTASTTRAPSHKRERSGSSDGNDGDDDDDDDDGDAPRAPSKNAVYELRSRPLLLQLSTMRGRNVAPHAFRHAADRAMRFLLEEALASIAEDDRTGDGDMGLSVNPDSVCAVAVGEAGFPMLEMVSGLSFVSKDRNKTGG